MKIMGAPLDVKRLSREDKLKRLKKAAKDFESIFFYELVKEMRKTVPKDVLLGEGLAEDIFKSMLDVEYGKVMALNGKWGLAELIYNQYKGKV